MPWPKSHISHSEQEDWPWNPVPWFLDQVFLTSVTPLGRKGAGRRQVGAKVS